MADNPITVNLPADLPEDWVENQIVAPEGQSVGLDQQHGYNYLMEQVNNAQTAASQIGAAFSGLATTEDVDGTLKATIQVTYNGAQPANPVAVHNAAPLSHQNLYVDRDVRHHPQRRLPGQRGHTCQRRRSGPCADEEVRYPH